MDGSRFSDPIKIKPRATESLSLPVGNCGEGSIRSKTSSGYYILVIVFLTIPSPFNWCLLLSLFRISKPPLNPLYLIFFPSGNAIRVLDVFTWNWFFPRSFDWDLGLRAEIGCNFIFVIIIFKRHLLLHSLLWREGLICSNWRKIVFFLNRFFSFVILALHSWLVYLIGLCHKITSRIFSILNVLCQVFDHWKKNLRC